MGLKYVLLYSGYGKPHVAKLIISFYANYEIIRAFGTIGTKLVKL